MLICINAVVCGDTDNGTAQTTARTCFFIIDCYQKVAPMGLQYVLSSVGIRTMAGMAWHRHGLSSVETQTTAFVRHKQRHG